MQLAICNWQSFFGARELKVQREKEREARDEGQEARLSTVVSH